MKALLELCERGVEEKLFPGGTFGVITARGEVRKAFGSLDYSAQAEKATLGTLYDLASLTKVISTTPLAMLAVQEGLLDLDQRVQHYIPAFEGEHKKKVLVRHLLLHNSGLPEYRRYDELASTPQDVVALILAEELQALPGERMVYSCLGIIILQFILESLREMSIEAQFDLFVARRLRLQNISYRPTKFAKCAPTIRPEPVHQRYFNKIHRGKLTPYLRGIVRDPIACSLYGVSGNAGLFGSIGDVMRFVRTIMSEGKFGKERIFDTNLMRSWTKRHSDDSTRGLGWETNGPDSSCGELFGPRSFGHTGYNGTSIWIDPDAQIGAILLTNRIHPDDTSDISAFRREFHDTVVRNAEEISLDSDEFNF